MASSASTSPQSFSKVIHEAYPASAAATNDDLCKQKEHMSSGTLPDDASDRAGRAVSQDDGSCLRSRRRSDTVRRATVSLPPTSEHAMRSGEDQLGEQQSARLSGILDDDDADVTESQEPGPASTTSPSASSSFTSATEATSTTNSSGSSSGSGSTVTQFAYRRRSIGQKKDESPAGSFQRRSNSQPSRDRIDVMTFLDPDSPEVTEDIIERTVRKSAAWKSSKQSPTARSESSSTSSNFSGDVFSDPPGDQDSERSSSPGASIGGDSPASSTAATSSTRLPPHLSSTLPRPRTSRYGTPEMPRGTANHPHLPPHALQPRKAAPHHVKPLPRAEKLPLTGYELLASKLSTGGPGGPTIKPIYRRFEALNHRLLLHLQDELSELEEQLKRLDTTDTQTRRAQDGILPSSRRNEYLLAGELQWHKAETLGKIGFKLGQYNHVLSSFTTTQGLPSPAFSDVQDYRSYLATHQPIAELETRFLDPIEDLVSLARPPSSAPETEVEEDARTPMPRCADATFLPSAPSPGFANTVASNNHALASDIGRNVGAASSADLPHDVTLPQLAFGMAVAVLLPILTFSVIPGFVGRMVVVFLVGLGVLSGSIQGGFVHLKGDGAAAIGGWDWLVCAGAYGGVMAVVASLFG